MRTIHTDTIIEAVRALCIDANCNLGGDVRRAILAARAKEEAGPAAHVLEELIKNADIARDGQIPICQDTGMAVFFVRLGQQVHIEGGLLTEAIAEGVRRGYQEGYLRKSVVADPIRRGNTGDNTPPVIHLELTAGDRLELTFAPKGFGSENMSAAKMLKPAEGLAGVMDFVTEAVRRAGSNPCPPVVVGVGLGGTFEKCALLSKYALTREIGSHNPDPYYAELEQTLLERINALGIGPQGLGGRTTALAVHIETFPTHIAGLPCCVNLN
ncbi:MAG: fumarate hydratase, partial [Clostridia bacterium]